jgi:hypothetical protein
VEPVPQDRLPPYPVRIVHEPERGFVLTGGAGLQAEPGGETLVNGAPLQGEHPLRSGDEIQIGATKFRFEE